MRRGHEEDLRGRRGVLVLTGLGPRSAAAQGTLVPGVKGGLSISTFGEPWSTLKNPTVGAFLSIGLNSVLSVQPEVFWLTQGEPSGGAIITTRWGT